MTDIPTVEAYAQSYIDVLNGPANGLGQHRCPTTGRISHEMYRIGLLRYGPAFDDTLDMIFERGKS